MATAGVCNFGWKAPAFSLPDPGGRVHDLGELAGRHGTLVAFICNHCPYVKAIAAPLADAARELAMHRVSVVAICSNDAVAYPADAPDQMAAFAVANGFEFPYLVDESQDVARAYDAQCTPDFFGFNADMELQYRGRFDSSGAGRAPGGQQDLLEAMVRIAETGEGPRAQTPSIGCSIKWKTA